VPAVGDHDRSRLDGALDEGQKGFSGGIGNALHPNAPNPPPIHLRGYNHESLVPQMSAAAAFFHPADKGFIHLHLTRHPIPPRSHHRPPQLLKTRPGRLITAQTQQPLQAKGADPMLLIGDPGFSPGGGAEQNQEPRLGLRSKSFWTELRAGLSASGTTLAIRA
jgi:hypothetical protein